MRRLILFIFLLQLWPAQVSAQYFSAKKNYKAAISAFKERNYYSARLLFQEIVHKDPLGDYGDDAQYYLALTYFYEGEYKSSIFEFRVLMRDYPTSKFTVRADYWVGECYFFLKDYTASLETHHAFVRKHPNHKRAAYSLYTTGYIYMQQKRYDEAIAEFKRALDKYADSKIAPDIALNVGIAFYNSREYSEARRQFRDLILRYGKSNMVDDAQFWIGKTHFEEGNYPDAEKEFGYVIQKFPKQSLAPEALYFIGLCRYKQKDLDGSLARLRQIRSKYPRWKKTDQVFFRMGQIYNEQNKAEPAVARFNSVVKNFPDSEYYLPSIELLGNILQKQGKGAQAIALYDRLLNNEKTDPKVKPTIMRKKASILFLDKNYDGASKVFANIYETYPNRKDAPEAMYMHAQGLVNQNLNSEALAKLKELVDRYPDSKWKVDAYFLQGEVYFSLSNFTRALQSYRKITRFYPKHRRDYEAMMGVGYSYFQLRQFARAGDQFKKVLRKYKKREQAVHANLELASCLYNLRDFKGALRLYRKIKKSYRDFAGPVEEAYFQTAWVYQRQKKYKRAAKELRNYLKRYPDGKRMVAAYYFLGWAEYYQGNFDPAIKGFDTAYKKAPEESPFKEKALLDLSKAQKAAEHHRDASANLRLFIRQFPKARSIEEAHFSLSEAYLAQKKPNMVMPVYDQLKAKSPASPYLAEILRSLGDYYQNTGNTRRAEEIYSRIIESSKSVDEKLEAEFARVALFVKTNRQARAKTQLKKILDNKNEEYIPYKSRAVVAYLEILFGEKKYDTAIAMARKYRPQFRDDPTTQKDLKVWQGRALIKLKRYKQANKLLAKLLRDRSMGTLARFYAGVAWYHRGKLNRAYDYFKQVLQKSKDVLAPRSLYYMGEINLKKKKYSRAIRDYTKIVYLYTAHSELYEKALYKTAYCFKRDRKNKEYNSYLEKLRDAFPKSRYIAKLQQL